MSSIVRRSHKFSSVWAIADLFVPQVESINTYPFLGNSTEEGISTFLQALYENLFNRDLDNAGKTFGQIRS